jgi:hypothetical protein
MSRITLALCLLASPLCGQSNSPSTIEASYRLLVETKIPELAINQQPFSKAFQIIQAKWEEQHPEATFPVSVTEFVRKKDDYADYRAVVTLRLKNVPFHEALLYLAESSRMRLEKSSGLLNLSQVQMITEDWSTRIHQVDDAILDRLELTHDSSSEEIRAAYGGYEIKLEDWMTASIADHKLVVMTYQKYHSRIDGLHHLIRSGFSITRDEKPEN